MKTNHRRGFVAKAYVPRVYHRTSRLTGKWVIGPQCEAHYDGHRGFARAVRGAKRRLVVTDRIALKRETRELTRDV